MYQQSQHNWATYQDASQQTMQHTNHHKHRVSSAPTCLTRPHTADEISETGETFKNLARQILTTVLYKG